MKTGINKYERILGDKESQSDFWPSFTDMLTTILLVVLLAAIVSISQTYEELKKNEEIIESFIGVKGEIIKDLTEKFEESKIVMSVDKSTGDICFNSSVLFDYDSSELKEDAKSQLQAFIPIYMKVLMQYEEELEEIIVEGHTDSLGEYLYNLNLSQDRAFSVMYYILSDEFSESEYKKTFKKYATANGKSFSQPMYKKVNGEDVIDEEASRRVVFKFRLKGTEYLNKKIKGY